MSVAQLAEFWIVIPRAVGSSPIAHPTRKQKKGLTEFNAHGTLGKVMVVVKTKIISLSFFFSLSQTKLIKRRHTAAITDV